MCFCGFHRVIYIIANSRQGHKNTIHQSLNSETSSDLESSSPSKHDTRFTAVMPYCSVTHEVLSERWGGMWLTWQHTVRRRDTPPGHRDPCSPHLGTPEPIYENKDAEREHNNFVISRNTSLSHHTAWHHWDTKTKCPVQTMNVWRVRVVGYYRSSSHFP